MSETSNPAPAQSPADLRQQEYSQRILVAQLRRAVHTTGDPSASPLLEKLVDAEAKLQEIEVKRAAATEPGTGIILDTKDASSHRGGDTTGLEVKVGLGMTHAPTSIYHLLDPKRNPLVTGSIKAVRRLENGPSKRRVRVRSYIDGYSATAVNTFEIAIGAEVEVTQLPTLFPDRIHGITELTRATLNVVVEDLDGRVEQQQTEPIWLLPRTCAPLAVMDPKTGKWNELTDYLGAFVTPNAPSLMTFLREAARSHPNGLLAGYQGEEKDVPLQVKALFDALKKAEITYINSVLDLTPQQGFASQRVRLPRESLADRSANCIDGTVLFASLLEGISMSPAIVLVPGHAFLAWETWEDSGKWRYLETTMIGSASFEQACDSATNTAKAYAATKQLTLLPLKKLRAELGILPME